MKSVRKVISVLLVIAMLTALGITSSAKLLPPQTSEDGLWGYYFVGDGTVGIRGYFGYDTDLTVPAEIDGYAVSTLQDIYEGDFGPKNQIRSLTVSEGIKKLDTGFMLWYTPLEQISLPDSIEYVGCNVFFNTGYYKNADNWENGMLYIDGCLIDANVSGECVVKDGTRVIGEHCFCNCRNLTSVVLPEGLRTICDYAFGFCEGLESITIPDGVTLIGSYAFADCTALSRISLPASLEAIGEYAFGTTAYVNDAANRQGGAVYIGEYLICGVDGYEGEITVKDGTRLIADKAFSNADAVTIITLPDTIRIIGNGAFSDCDSLKSVVMQYGIEIIGSGAFAGSALIKKIVIPDSIVSFGKCVFNDCAALETAVLGEGIKELSEYEFENCISLSEVRLPETLESIGDNAFSQCPKLKSIIIPDSVRYIGSPVFCAYVDKSNEWGEQFRNVWTCCLEVIYAHVGTYAEQYAREHSFEFRFIETGTFPDVSANAWFYEAAKYNFEHGFIKGYGNYNFGPSDSLQRQDFIVILARINGADLDAYDKCGLTDVDMKSYYGRAVAWAVDNGIIKGYENGKFGVGDPVTREQVATVFYRYAKTSECANASVLDGFEDSLSASEFSREALVWAVASGVINGRNATVLAPRDTAARAEIATMVMRMDMTDMFNG